MKTAIKTILLTGIMSACVGLNVQATEELNTAGTEELLFRQYVDCVDLDLKYYFEYEYDSDGKLSERRECDENGGLNSRTEYTYDENGYVVSKITYKPNGSINEKIICQNDSDGNVLLEKIERDGSKAERRYEYDSDEKLIKMTYSDDESERSWIYTYDDERIIQVDYINGGKTTVDARYEYDDKGNVISEMGDGNTGNIYEYDENGLKTKDTYIINGETYMISTFEYCTLDDAEEVIEDSEVICKVQEELNKKGFSCGTPDGIAGDATKKAVIAFMQSIGKESNGNINRTVLSELGIANGTQFAVDSSESFVARGDTSLMDFLTNASDNGCSLENPNNTGTYVYVDCKYNGKTYSVKYFVERQKVYNVDIMATTNEELSDSEWRGCAAALAKSLNPNIGAEEIEEGLNDAINSPDNPFVVNSTLFRFSSERMELEISH